jgi:hypothetical protein
MELKYSPFAYLLGTDSTWSAANVTGPTTPRALFRHHTVQRIVKNGEAGNPAVLIQMRILPEDALADTQAWTTIATLDNTTRHVFIPNSMLVYIRAVRADDSTDQLKVVVYSGNDRDDEG